MANKRFVKPIRPNATIPAIADQGTINANRDALWRDEYRYALAYARKRYPNWTLAERQAYAQRSAHALFDGDVE